MSMNSDQKLAYFSNALNYYMHQNSLMWDRLKHCLTIQVVSIGGAYAAKSALLTPLMLFLGALLSICFLLIFNRDRQIRDTNAKLVLELAEKLREEFKDEIQNYFTTKVPPAGYAPFSAGNFFRIILSIIVFMEACLGFLLLINPTLLQKI